jgi:MoxR-like ATPase
MDIPGEGVLSQPTQVEDAVARVLTEVRKAIVGQDDMIQMLAVALLANGHVLLEGVPGTAKTLAARAFGRACAVSFARIQFTPDLMPSDVLGTNVFEPSSATFRLRKGPVFAGLVLADEINRTPPKTQAALLEAMEEHRVTIDGISHDLPRPFLVCATQNPVEFEGTYPLPEAQLDRFMLKVVLDYPSDAEEQQILARYQEGFRAADLDTAGVQPVVGPDDIAALRGAVDRVEASADIRRYVVAVVRAIRGNQRVVLGPSPRASVTLMLAAKALAAIRGRDFVTPDDVKSLAPAVLRHRIILRPESEIEGHTADRVVAVALDAVEVPR